MLYDLIIVGGGAAGFFAAIEAASQKKGIKILILEKSTKLLSKVGISGGGRCNVTHHCFEPSRLASHYPRGQKELKKMFRVFHAEDAVKWFEHQGVNLVTEDDGRMFPITDTSQTIIDCFLHAAKNLNIEILTSSEVSGVHKTGDEFSIQCRNGKSYVSQKILVAMGGHPQPGAYSWIKSMGHTVIPPIPSLFTFNDPSKLFTDLMGVAVQDAEVKIAGTKFSARGPVLITHWGLSGPAVIRLSAWAAPQLNDVHYEFTALVNWTGHEGEESVRQLFRDKNRTEGAKRIASHPMFHLPQRLWEKLCSMAEVNDNTVWAEAPAKSLNRLLEYIIRCPFQIQGKTTFKEEFVTCGGVDLKEIDLTTMESKVVSGLYFAGEVIHVDGETGGFNFQAAWTTAYIAAQALTKFTSARQV